MAGAGTLDVVVVGGGITGAFAAFFLAGRHVSVTLIEREGIGGQASGNNPGGLNPLYGPAIPGPLQALALEAFALHLEHWDEFVATGVDFAGRRKQRLNLATDAGDVARLETMKANYDRHDGFSARWLERDELLAIEPRLAPTVTRGLLAGGDGRVDPGPYTRAVAAAAVTRGARVVTDEVHGLELHDGRVTGVLASSGAIACDAVVIATGPWCREPSRWLEVELPMEPVKGELVLVEPVGGGVGIDLAWRDSAAYSTGGAAVWLGGNEERSGFDRATTAAARTTIVRAVGSVLPAFADAPVVDQVAGLRPLTPDGLPIVGCPGAWTNVCVALGGGRKGMLFGAALGRAAADLLLDGGTGLAIDPCLPARFAA